MGKRSANEKQWPKCSINSTPYTFWNACSIQKYQWKNFYTVWNISTAPFLSLSLSRLYRVQKTYPYRIRSIRFDFIYRFKLLFEQKKMENFSLVFCVHFFFNSVYNTNVFAPQLSLFFVSFWNAFSGLYYLAIKLIHFHNFNEMVYKWLKACIFTWKTLAQRNGSMKTRK